MVQDLWIINEAVVPHHSTEPNPYVILGEILPHPVPGGLQSWISNMHSFAYHWLKNHNIFLPLSGRLQEKDTIRLTLAYPARFR